MDQLSDHEQAVAPPPADSGLRCPACEYNLTGVAEDRCPECGTPFDPVELQFLLAGAPRPLPYWDDLDKPLSSRFVRTCLATWFTPWRVGRQFPRFYNRRSAFEFRCLVLMFGFLVSGLCLAGQYGPDWLGNTLGYFFGVLLSETILIVFFDAFLGVRAAGRESRKKPGTDSWRGLIGFFRTFVIFGIILYTGAQTPARYGWGFQINIWSACIFGLLLIWWWAALGAAVASHAIGVSIARRTLAIALISIPVLCAAAMVFAETR